MPAMGISTEPDEKSAHAQVVSPTPSEKDTGDVIQPAAAVLEKPKRSWKSYVWDTFDKSPEERKFMFKLDLALMTLASLGYFIKYLDQVRRFPGGAVRSMLTRRQGQHQQRVRFGHERRFASIRK